ncbi:MAB_1171c family putative transporter [Streptomyces sp. NPDC088194]|uniref:MAB_1171c family putative transporter n=1 Tax=Streptomyces sp. NPDC088194 TaxID=3154931 RepID=UPI00344D62C5
MADLLSFLGAAFFLVFGAHRLAITRGARADSAQRHVSGFALCMGLALVFNAPSVTDRLARDPTLDTLVGLITHDLKLAAFAFLVLVAYSLRSPTAGRRAVRRQVWTAGATLAASVALFLAACPATTSEQLSVSPGHRWALASYSALFAAYGAWCLLVLARELADHVERTAPGLLRTGLRLMMLAAAFGAAWTAWTLDDVISDLSVGHQDIGEDMVSSALGAITALLATGGATATLWGDALGAPVRWLRAYHRYRALEPLWSALHRELPQIALDPSVTDRRPGLPRAEFALYRRVIEIHDGHLALRPYFDSDVARWTAEAEAGDRDRDRHAVLEAATIAAALENKRAGRRCDAAGAPRQAPAAPAPPPVPGTVAAETAWLLEVTAAFTGSPAVADVRRRVRHAVDVSRRDTGRGPGGSGAPGGPGVPRSDADGAGPRTG